MRTSTMRTNRSRAPITTATASRSSNSSRRTIRCVGRVPRGPVEAARVASQQRSRRGAHPPRLEHHDRRSRSQRDHPRCVCWTSAALPTWLTAARTSSSAHHLPGTFDCFPAWAPTDGALGSWNSQYDSISLRDTNNVWIDHKRSRSHDRGHRRCRALRRALPGARRLFDTQRIRSRHALVEPLPQPDKMMLIGSSDTAAADPASCA